MLEGSQLVKHKWRKDRDGHTIKRSVLGHEDGFESS